MVGGPVTAVQSFEDNFNTCSSSVPSQLQLSPQFDVLQILQLTRPNGLQSGLSCNLQDYTGACCCR